MSVTGNYDLVIVGGGMAGSCLAWLLSHHTKDLSKQPRIALVEAAPLEFGQHPGFDGRAIALSAGSQQILQRGGLWLDLAPFAESIAHIQVSDRGHWGRVDLNAEQYGLKALGQVVELEHAGEVLHRRIAKLPNVELLASTSISEIETYQQHQKLVTEDGRELVCSLLVGADGAQSMVARHCALESRQLDFNQVAVIANLRGDKSHQGWAYERFTEQGPIALLPMTDNRWSLVWCMERGKEAELINLDEVQFLKRLQNEFGLRAGRFENFGKRLSYPLVLRLLEQTIAHRAVVLGNAAHALHPIAGQGFNLGLRDASLLAETLAQQWQQQQDLGCYSLLADYRRQRRGDVQATSLITSGLASLFSTSDKTSVIPRNIALMLMQRSDALKQPLLTQCLGLGQRF